MNFKNPYFLGILSITIVGAFLRLYHLDYNSIWGDELYTFMFAQNSFLNIWSSFATDVHPPLFYWIEHLILLFNQSDFAIRIIPCIFGIATIPLMYQFGKEFISEKVGIISALFLSLSTFHIYYAQDARMYTMWLFFFLISLILYLRAIKTNSTNYWLVFGIVSAICLWTFFYSIIFFVLLILYAILKRSIPKEAIAVAIASFGVVTFTLIPSMITIFTKRTSIPVWFGYQGLDVIRGVFYEFFGYYTMYVFLMVFLMIFGSIILWKTNKEKIHFIGFIIASSLVVSILVGYKMPMVGRYLVVITPLVYILVSIPLVHLIETFKKSKKVMSVIVITMIILVNIPLLGIYYTTWQKEDLKGLSREISNITKDGDHLVILTDGMVFLHYYDNTTDKTILHTNVKLEELKQINETRGSSNMIVMPPYDISGYLDEVKWLEENNNELKVFGKEIKIYVF